MSENRYDHGAPQMGQNPSMYHPNGLSPEEAALMRQLRFESSWKAGYPMALITGGTIAMLTKNRVRSVRIASTIAGVVVGNIVGKLSYVPTIHKRILEDLPESSQLRQRVASLGKFGEGSKATSDESSDDGGLQFSTGSSYDMKNMEPEVDEKDKPKKYITYEELRRKHRSLEQTGPFPQSVPSASSSDKDDFPSLASSGNIDIEPESNIPSGGKVRYNKYGDPIIE